MLSFENIIDFNIFLIDNLPILYINKKTIRSNINNISYFTGNFLFFNCCNRCERLRITKS